MTTTERQSLPAVVCTPWCEHGDGHTNAIFRGDQTCWGPSDYVDLSLEEIIRAEGDVYTPRIGAMAYRHWSHTPCVYVHLDNIAVPGRNPILDTAIHLTADEAARLGATLLKAAKDIRGNQTG